MRRQEQLALGGAHAPIGPVVAGAAASIGAHPVARGVQLRRQRRAHFAVQRRVDGVEPCTLGIEPGQHDVGDVSAAHGNSILELRVVVFRGPRPLRRRELYYKL
jgi:hypothetical protein